MSKTAAVYSGYLMPLARSKLILYVRHHHSGLKGINMAVSVKVIETLRASKIRQIVTIVPTHA